MTSVWGKWRGRVARRPREKNSVPSSGRWLQPACAAQPPPLAPDCPARRLALAARGRAARRRAPATAKRLRTAATRAKGRSRLRRIFRIIKMSFEGAARPRGGTGARSQSFKSAAVDRPSPGGARAGVRVKSIRHAHPNLEIWTLRDCPRQRRSTEALRSRESSSTEWGARAGKKKHRKC